MRNTKIRWVSMIVLVAIAITGPSFGSYRLFDDFQDENVGPVGGQDGWIAFGGDIRVVVDPADPNNQVLYVPSDSSILRKSTLLEYTGVPDGTARMFFTRIRVSQKQTFSFGLSGMSAPSEFHDFATEIGMANSAQNLDLRVWDDAEGNYEEVTQLQPDRWYNMWILADAALNTYRIWLNDVPGGSAAPEDLLSGPGGDTFAFRTGDNRSLITFYVKTAGGGSSTNFGPVYFDDMYIELSSSLSLVNPAALNTSPEVHALALGPTRPTLLWNPQAWADDYDLIRGDLQTMRALLGDFSVSVNACLEDGDEDDTAEDVESPLATHGFYYLVRGNTESLTGTYDCGHSSQTTSRDPGIAAASSACP